MKAEPAIKKINSRKRQLLRFGVAFFLFSALLSLSVASALAGERESSVSVSCIIPAIPGLNAPPIDREK